MQSQNKATEANAFTIIELSGHIIDSLTLAKVIDKIQAAGCHYQINDLQIGEKKSDISYAQISLWLEDSGSLENLLKDLETYGAYSLQNRSVSIESCPDDAILPDRAYVRLNPPIEVMYDGKWIPVERQGFDVAIVLDPESGRASFRSINELKKGDKVVLGKEGIRILPTLGENINASRVVAK